MAQTALSGLRVDSYSTPQTKSVPSRDRADTASTRSDAHAATHFTKYARRPSSHLPPLCFGIVIALILSYGWLAREDDTLTPKSGVGYWLGIIGAGSMLLLLLYPLRKRTTALRALGTVAFWFRLHMVLGVVGPVLILFHANFALGSMNSNVALIAMLIVAASGLVGRYLYGKIHLGLYGRRAEVAEVLADADAIKHLIGSDLPIADAMIELLAAFAALGAASPRGVLAGVWMVLTIGQRARAVHRRLRADARRAIAVEGKRLGWSWWMRRRRLAAITQLVALHVRAVEKAAALAFYERLFNLWHLLHLPLFVLLVFAASVHVFAAHFF